MTKKVRPDVLAADWRSQECQGDREGPVTASARFWAETLSRPAAVFVTAWMLGYFAFVQMWAKPNQRPF